MVACAEARGLYCHARTKQTEQNNNKHERTSNEQIQV